MRLVANVTPIVLYPGDMLLWHDGAIDLIVSVDRENIPCRNYDSLGEIEKVHTHNLINVRALGREHAEHELKFVSVHVSVNKDGTATEDSASAFHELVVPPNDPREEAG